MALDSVLEILCSKRMEGESHNQLVARLKNNGEIPKGKLQDFQRSAAAAEYYEKNKWMQVQEQFTDPMEMIEFLRENKPDENSLSYLTLALWTGGKIPGDKLKNFQFTAGAAEYYEKNRWMQVQEQFTDPLEMIDFIRKNKQDDNSLSYLTQALWAGGKIPKDKQQWFQRTAAAAD